MKSGGEGSEAGGGGVLVVLGPALLAGLALRLAVLVHFAGSPWLRAPLLDAAVYDSWARRLAAGMGNGSEAYFLAPLYPYLLAGIYAVARDGPLLAVAVQHLLGLGLVLGCGRAALRLGGPLAGAATAWLVALHGPLVIYENLLLAEVVGACLLTAAVLLLLRAPPAGGGRALLSGLLVGLDALVRPTGLLIGVALAAWLGWRRPGRRPALLLLLGLLLAVLPVTVRNRLVAGEWLLVTSSGGYNLYVGNHAQADGTYVQPPEVRFAPGDAGGDATGRRAAELAAGRQLTAGEVSRYWLGRSWAAMRAAPGRSLRLYLRKIALVWNRFEVPQVIDLRDVERQQPWLRPYGWLARLVLPLALAGLLVAYPDRRQRLLLVLAIAAFTLITALFFVTARYRVQAVPLLCMLAGGSVARLVVLVRERSPRRRRRLGLAALGLAACALLTTPDLLALRGSGEPWLPAMKRALRLAATGADSTTVLAAFDAALAQGAGVARLHANRGEYRLGIGDAAGAERDFARAVRLDPQDPVAWTGLGRARLERGGAARPALERALALEPDYAPAQLAFARTLARQGRASEAEAVLRRALAGPAAAAAHAALGRLLLESGRRPEGIEQLAQAAKLDPRDPRAHFNLGLALLEEGRLAAARQALDEALGLDPGYRPAARALVAVLVAQGELERAAQLVDRLLLETPGDRQLEAARDELARRRRGGGTR